MVTATQHGHLAVDKTGSLNLGTNGKADPGDVMTFTITVKNDGNVTLHDVKVTDAKCDAPGPAYISGDTNSNNKLDVGETWTFRCTRAITQADIDAGKVDNSATGTAKDPTTSP